MFKLTGLVFVLLTGVIATAAEQSLFNGKDLSGWEGNTGVWRVRDGAIVGGSLDGNAQNEFLTYKRRYKNFRLSFEYKIVAVEGAANGGVQFRSERIQQPPNEMEGYQMDLGMGRSGFLYDESRRKRFLAQSTKEKVAQVEKAGEWNRATVHCEGPRIQLFVNDERIVEFTEDKADIPQRGLIGLQVHGKSKAEISYRALMMEVLPETSKSTEFSPGQRMANAQKRETRPTSFVNGRFSLKSKDVVVFVGGENVVAEQDSGWIEAAITAEVGKDAPIFRNMGWEGDTIYRQPRPLNWGSWKENLNAVGATTIVVWLGAMEAFEAERTLADYRESANRFLDELATVTPRIVVISPAPIEASPNAQIPSNHTRNDRLRQHGEILRSIAQERGYVFVDVFEPLLSQVNSGERLTRDGIHFTPAGLKRVSALVAQQLFGEAKGEVREELRKAIVDKNGLWFDAWRSMNWNFAYGDRTTQLFARGTSEFPAFAENLSEYPRHLTRGDEVIRSILEGRPAPQELPPPPPRPDPAVTTTEEQMKRFKVRDGYSVNLFADETLGVVRPVQMSWDEAGRLWVLCVPSYPHVRPGERANDYLLVLEDSDGDGRADKATRFAEGLNMPMGFEFARDGVYVCESTQIILLRDSQQTGKATQREVVLSGFGTGDSHQKINSLRWGPDGWLWFTQGLHIVSAVETPQGIVELDGAGLWRFNPRTLELRSYLQGSVAGQNCWGVAFDDFGQPFHGSGADRHLWHTTPALVSPTYPKQLPGIAGTIGKSMSPEFLGSRRLPPELRGALVKGTYFTNQVSLFRLQDDGSTFVAESLGDLLASSGNEFRPLEAMSGPDGAIYVCDWVNPIIGHYQASYRDPRRVLSHGRIWRVDYTRGEVVRSGKLQKMTDSELLRELSSPERWVREQAKSALYRRPTSAVVAAADSLLDELLASPKASAGTLYEISGVFSAHEAVRPALLGALLKSEDFRARGWGTRLIGLWGSRLPDALAYLTRTVRDESPRVRLEAVVAAAALPFPETIEIATRVMERSIDEPLQYALTQAIHALSPIWRRALAAGELKFTGRPDALALVLSTAGGPESAAALRQLAGSPDLTGKQREGVLIALASVGSPSDLDFIISQPVSSAVLDALATQNRSRKVRPSVNLETAIAGWLSSGDKSLCESAWRLVGEWKLMGLLDDARKVSFARTAVPAERVAAIDALGALGAKAVVEDLKSLTADADAAVRLAALARLAKTDLREAAGPAISMLQSAENVAIVRDILRPFLGNTNGLSTLGDSVSPALVASPAARWISQVLAEEGRSSPALVAALSKENSVAQALDGSPARISSLVETAKTKGDVARGKLVYEKPDFACIACHQVNGAGGTLGPDLSAIGRVAPADFIVESVLFPKRAVKEGYILTRIVTKDGREVLGTLTRQSKDVNIVREVGTGVIHEIKPSDIVSRSSAESLMPEGLTAAMSEQELNDLFAYLIQLGR